MMSDKKQWVEPEIEEVALESEDEVLALCYTASLTLRTGATGNNCRNSRCWTYP